MIQFTVRVTNQVRKVGLSIPIAGKSGEGAQYSACVGGPLMKSSLRDPVADHRSRMRGRKCRKCHCSREIPHFVIV